MGNQRFNIEIDGVVKDGEIHFKSRVGCLIGGNAAGIVDQDINFSEFRNSFLNYSLLQIGAGEVSLDLSNVFRL